MGLISRVSSRTYRKTSTYQLSPWKRKTKSPNNRSRSPTSGSPSPLKAQKLWTKHVLKSAVELRPSTAEVKTTRSKSKDHDQCRLEECELPPGKLHVVKVPKPGIDTRCESTSESSSLFADKARF